MYKVTNKMEDARQFVDGHTGQIIVLGPNESCIANSPRTREGVFDVEEIEKTVKKTKKE